MLNGHNANLLENLISGAENGRVSHAYLFSGENLTESYEMADRFAEALAKSAADRLYPAHEKPQLFSVDDVRREINATVHIAPYEGPKKVYIVRDADRMNVQAQNALLKTLEEPPEYVVMILIARNSVEFLPTILSRCVKLNISSFGADGDEEKDELREIEGMNRELLRNALRLELQTIREYAQTMDKKKDYAEYALEDLRGWFRDVLLYQAEPKATHLIHKNDLGTVKNLAEKTVPAGIGQILSEIDGAKLRIASNVNTELSFEVLLMHMKEDCKEVR